MSRRNFCSAFCETNAKERIQPPRFSETTVLVDGICYLTALAWCDLRGHLNYVERNLIEKWFQTLAM